MAQACSKASRAGVHWGLEALVCQHLSLPLGRPGPGRARDTANAAVLEEGRRLLVNDPSRLEGVRVIGVDDSPARCAPKREVPPLCDAITGAGAGPSPWSSTSPLCMRAPAGHGCWTWPGPLRAGPGGLAGPAPLGSGGRRWRWSRWTPLPVSRPPRARSWPGPPRCWNPSASSTLQARPWRSAHPCPAAAARPP